MKSIPEDTWQKTWPEKFAPLEAIFDHVHPGDRIFIGTACGEPQHLVSGLIGYVEGHPAALFDAELVQVWTLGVAPYAEERFKQSFRLNSFFVSDGTRSAVNRGAADYTPISLSAVPELFKTGRIPLDVALIQTTPPNERGEMNLGISVDIVRAAVEKASLVVAQTSSKVPRIPGDGKIRAHREITCT